MLWCRAIGRFGIIIAVTLLLAACGGGGGVSGPSVDLTGTYRFNGRSSTVGGFTGMASISQAGSGVSGTFQNNLGFTYRLNGSVNGTHVTGQLIGTNNANVCSFEAEFFPDGTVGQGTYRCNTGETGSGTTVRV
jgi:hypothetical protein